MPQPFASFVTNAENELFGALSRAEIRNSSKTPSQLWQLHKNHSPVLVFIYSPHALAE